jgi:NAD(P)H-flavin reductase
MPALADALRLDRVEEAMRPRLHRVLRCHRETYDTVTLELDAAGDAGFQPGQFNMLSVPGTGEVAVSISGDPGDDSGLLVHTTRAVGGVTRAITSLHAGDLLGVRGPFGTAWPVRDAEGSDVVVVAGGIGLAPLRPALLHLLRHRERYGRVVLLYGARTPQDMLFVSQLESWRRRFDVEVAVSVDRAAPGWRGNVGVVTTLVPRAPFDAASAMAMICGPEVMMRFAAAAIEERGVPADRVWLSMERNMQCGVGLCGHCQLGPLIICRDGPVLRHDRLEPWMAVREL